MPAHDTVPGFRWDAEDYARSSPAQKQWSRELIQKINLSGRERVLDIGCGDGTVTAAIAECVPEGSVIGIDRSPGMIRFAREQFPHDAYPNLSFAEGDAQNLGFSGEFDIVFSNAALHWVYDQGPVLTGIARALRDGGRMIVQMGGKGNAAQVFIALDALLADPGWGQYFCDFSFRYGFFSPSEYRPWLETAGLLPVRVELIPKEMVYPARDGFCGWLRTTWLPYLERVPEARRSEFVDALADTVLALYPPDPDGAVHIEMMRLEVEAKKR
ncbi:MAG: methyltransferase domain-containing protein [Methanoregula sp.]|jgi:trans-aconitate methyltransferase|uniref:class I SAM-dependent methyltransferase n=1 Tax=Methanoregula sp. TaxID=2052170 RepID=UPI003D0FFD90